VLLRIRARKLSPRAAIAGIMGLVGLIILITALPPQLTLMLSGLGLMAGAYFVYKG
jgi:hypothetical protein